MTENIRITVEFEVRESEREKVTKLIAYARKIGITQYATDSFDAAGEQSDFDRKRIAYRGY